MSSEALTPDDALIDGAPSHGQVTSEIAAPLEQRASGGWYALIAVTGTALLIGVALTAYTIATGIGLRFVYSIRPGISIRGSLIFIQKPE